MIGVRFAAGGQEAQAIGDILDDTTLGIRQRAGQHQRPLAGGVDDDAAIHHEEDAARRCAAFRRTARLACEGEHCDVDTRGLAGGGRQREHIGPARLARPGIHDLPCQPRLPGERVVAVYLPEEIGEPSR